MSRMIDLIRQSAVPVNIMRAAARGALALPPAEMLEILVLLTQNPVFAQQAGMTLAGWDEASSLAAAEDRQTAGSVLEYFSRPENLRPRLLPVLLENPAVPESRLVELARSATHERITAMLASPRVQACAAVLQSLAGNEHLNEQESRQVKELLARLGQEPKVAAPDDEPYEVTHAAEIAAEEGKPFTLVSVTGDVLGLGFDDVETPAEPEGEAVTLEVLPALESKAAQPNADPQMQRRVSTLFRIAQMPVRDRVRLAMEGNREERFILIRDGAKVVANAVLESPKLTESEIEIFASMRNVQESVLRRITMKRKYMKMYTVVKALANNPRSPLDIALPLLNHLLINDLKTLSMNRNINDTIRSMAARMVRKKVAAAAGSK